MATAVRSLWRNERHRRRDNGHRECRGTREHFINSEIDHHPFGQRRRRRRRRCPPKAAPRSDGGLDHRKCMLRPTGRAERPTGAKGERNLVSDLAARINHSAVEHCGRHKQPLALLCGPNLHEKHLGTRRTGAPKAMTRANVTQEVASLAKLIIHFLLWRARARWQRAEQSRPSRPWRCERQWRPLAAASCINANRPQIGYHYVRPSVCASNWRISINLGGRHSN